MRGTTAAAVLALACGAPASSPRAPADDWALDAEAPAPAPDAPPAAAGDDAPEAARPVAPAPRARIYRGHRIDVSFVDVELHDAFRTLAEIGDVNIVVADDVSGRINLRLRRVPWDQVLDTIVALEGLRLDIDGGIYRISRP